MTEERERPGLALHMRIAGEAVDAVVIPDHFDVKEGVLALYREDEHGDLVIFEAYNLDIIEHFEVVPADELEDAMQKAKAAEYPEPVDLTGGIEGNPFRDNRLGSEDDLKPRTGGRAA